MRGFDFSLPDFEVGESAVVGAGDLARDVMAATVPGLRGVSMPCFIRFTATKQGLLALRLQLG